MHISGQQRVAIASAGTPEPNADQPEVDTTTQAGQLADWAAEDGGTFIALRGQSSQLIIDALKARKPEVVLPANLPMPDMPIGGITVRQEEPQPADALSMQEKVLLSAMPSSRFDPDNLPARPRSGGTPQNAAYASIEKLSTLNRRRGDYNALLQKACAEASNKIKDLPNDESKLALVKLLTDAIAQHFDPRSSASMELAMNKFVDTPFASLKGLYPQEFESAMASRKAVVNAGKPVIESNEFSREIEQMFLKSMPRDKQAVARDGANLGLLTADFNTMLERIDQKPGGMRSDLLERLVQKCTTLVIGHHDEKKFLNSIEQQVVARSGSYGARAYETFSLACSTLELRKAGLV